jgi:two-component system sensor histidine kinase/response regulator
LSGFRDPVASILATHQKNTLSVSPDQTDDRQTLRIRRFLIATASYGLATVLAGIGAWMGLWSVEVFVTYTVIAATINAVLYGVFVSGLNQQLSDPSLTEIQVAAAIGALLFMAWHAGAARGVVLLWMLPIFVFGVFRLKTAQLWRLAAVAWVAYCAIIYFASRHQPGFNLNLEIFQCLVLAGVLVWFIFMGGYVSAMRSRTRRSEALYRSMWETAADAAIIVDAEGRIEYANPAVQTVFGRAPEALTGAEILPLLAARTREGRDASFRQFLEACKKQSGDWDRIEMRFIRADGREFPAEVSAAEMQIEGRLAFLVFVRDITVRKQSEEALVAARIAAEASNRAKSQFLANMSHEVRTPMNGIIGMSEILLQEPLEAREREYVEIIHRAGQSLLGVLNDVLDFSRVEAGQIAIEHTVFDLPLVISDVAKLFDEEARAKDLRLTTELAPNLPRYVIGDSVRLRQVLTNLVANAVKFTEQGEVEIMVGAENQDRVRFEVRDTGIGIPPELQERMFDAFTQADGSMTRRYSGSGLGLAIVRGLVTLMNGETGLKSAPGRGSSFWFTLPLPVSAEGAAVGDAPPSANKHAGKKILLVEDDAINARIAGVLLANRGIEVTHAANGEKAVAVFRNARFDMIFMDCQMPVMDGFEATRHIRATEQARAMKRTPIAALTAHALASHREECLTAGMDDYIAKPIRVPEFDALLARWLADTPAV